MADDRSVEITVDAFLRVKRERDEARGAVRAIAARCWMLRQVARESDTALRAAREEVRRLVDQMDSNSKITDHAMRMIAVQRDEAREATEALGGMFEWQAEVIIDTRDALRTRREEWYGGSRVRPRMMIPTDIDAVLAILDRERNADPSRYDKARAERDAAIARAEAAEAAIGDVRALCDDVAVGLSYGCTCYGDEHIDGACRYGQPMAWSLDPNAIRRALDTGATT